MCTVCGHFVRNGEIPSHDIHDMLKKMEHRGPDTHSIYLDGNIERAEDIDSLRPYFDRETRIAFGHSRLKIVGTEERSQPYTSCDGRINLIHNGEIYNYQKLRSLLMRDHVFKTTSDSEVIVHLLEEVYRGELLDA